VLAMPLAKTGKSVYVKYRNPSVQVRPVPSHLYLPKAVLILVQVPGPSRPFAFVPKAVLILVIEEEKSF